MTDKRPRSEGYFTIWSGWLPLVVFRADSMREARETASSDEVQRTLRRATTIGKPVLPYGAKIWVSLAAKSEVAAFERAATGAEELVWLQIVDGSR